MGGKQELAHFKFYSLFLFEEKTSAEKEVFLFVSITVFQQHGRWLPALGNTAKPVRLWLSLLQPVIPG